MKKKYLLLAVLMFPFLRNVVAQQPSAEVKQIFKQQMEYCAPGLSGRNLVWDFSRSQIVDSNYVVEIIKKDTVADDFIQKEHNTTYYYKNSSDSLFCLGYEDHNVEILYANPLPVSIYSLRFGEQFSTEMSGSGVYGHLLPMQIEGKIAIESDAEGQLIFPDKKINNVRRFHCRLEYSVSGVDSTYLVEDRYQWFADGQKYPVLESILSVASPIDSISEIRQDTIVQTSFYYVPSEESIEKDKQAEIATEELDVYAVFADAQFLPNPVETDLYISYSLTRNANVGYSIHSASGLPILTREARFTEAGEHTDILSMTGCMRGGYTLYVYVDDYIIQEVIIKI